VATELNCVKEKLPAVNTANRFSVKGFAVRERESGRVMLRYLSEQKTAAHIPTRPQRFSVAARYSLARAFDAIAFLIKPTVWFARISTTFLANSSVFALSAIETPLIVALLALTRCSHRTVAGSAAIIFIVMPGRS
jgi:hypothetical protein